MEVSKYGKNVERMGFFCQKVVAIAPCIATIVRSFVIDYLQLSLALDITSWINKDSDILGR